MSEKEKIYIYFAQILFVGGISFSSNILKLEDVGIWGCVVARYIVYLLLIKGSHEASLLGCQVVQRSRTTDWGRLVKNGKPYLMIFAASVGVLLYFDQKILQKEFLLLSIGYLAVKYPEMGGGPRSINYGTGMACSFFEGYLQKVLPNDGGEQGGLEANATAFENQHGVVVPVKRLFVVITRSLYCPAELTEFNRPNSRARGAPYLEARQSLQDVTRNVAGVLNRSYRNSVYKICRPRAAAAPAAPVSLVAECATPLHTLHRVITNRMLYDHLGGVDVEEVVHDFCSTLREIIDKSPECSGKCELVYFDDTNPELNLAEVLLDRVREIEPAFENIRRA